MNWKGLSIFAILIIDTLILIMILNFIGFKNFGVYCISFFLSVIISTIILNLFNLVDASSWEKKNLNAKRKTWKGISLFIIISITLLLSALTGGYIAGSISGAIITLFLIYACPDFLYKINFYQESIGKDLEKWLNKKLNKNKQTKKRKNGVIEKCH